ETFERLDTNDDGKLSQLELIKWIVVAPDVELNLRLGKRGANEQGLEIVRARDRKSPLDSALRQADGESATLTVKASQFSLRMPPNPYQQYGQNVSQTFLQQYQFAAMQNKGVVDKKLVEQPQYRFLLNIFNAADRDEDGKLTEKEVKAYG